MNADEHGYFDSLIEPRPTRPNFFRWQPILPDPDDDRILELAVRAGSYERFLRVMLKIPAVELPDYDRLSS